MLALYGAKDGQIDAAGAAEAWRRALGRPGEVGILAGLNHFFQEADTGMPAEYATIEQTISPAALSTIEQWLQSNPE